MPKFLSNVEHDADIIDINGNSGTSGQVLSSLGPGNGVDWIDQTGGTSGVLSINVKNISGGTLTAGTAVSVATPSSNPPAGIVVEVIAADYDNINDMPAIGILKEDLNDDAEGEAVMMGSVSSINTNSFNVSDELYVGANGALVNSKPTTAGQLIQKIAVVVKKHSSNGVIKVLGAGRSNDVPLPLYIDNANQRVGISEPSPTEKLVVSETRTGSTASDAYTTVVKSVQSSGASPNPGTGGLKVQYTSSSSNVHAFGLVAGSSSSDFLTTGPMHFYTNSDLDTVSATGFAMQLDTSQRLTIGSMTASQKLNVAGNVTANRYYGNTSTQYYLDPNDVTTSAVLSGDVAIGDFATPAHRLVVRTPGGESGNTEDGVFIKSPFAGGSPVATDAQPFLSIGCRSASGGVSRIFMGKNATATSQESLISYSSDNDVLSIYKKQMGTYTEHVRFGNSGSTSTARTRFYGNVGIGTDPSAPLHVSGVSRATEGFSTDGNNKFYTWRALQNTGSSSNQYYRIARVTGSQSTRFIIELAGRSTSYNDGVLPAFGKIVGQLNNDNNFDIVYYNASATDEVVDEVGQVDVNTVQTDIYVRVGQYAELTATAHISDGAIVTYDSNSGSTSAPTNYVQATEYKLWNTGNGGSGSGLDADLLDGNHASAFASSSHTHAAGDITSGTFSTARIAHNSFDIGDTTAETGRSVHETGIYTFNRNNGNLGTGTNTSYYSVLAYGQGAGGSAQIATEWTNGGNKLYFRSLRDVTDNWWDWKEIYHTGHKPTYSELGTMAYSNLTGTPSSLPANGGNADTVDNYHANNFFRRIHKATATVGPGWMTVAENVSGRKAGEIIVTDADSGDHAYIRIEWMRSYADSNFTVLNCGGHQNRITGARVLYETSDATYGGKKLQVYVTTSSNYEVNIYEQGDIDDYATHSVVTPVIQNTISGYALHGNQLENLDTFGFAAEEGILSGGDLKVLGGDNGIHVDSAGHASLRLDRGSTSYDNNVLFMTGGGIKWRLWQDGTDDQLMIRDNVNSYNSVIFNAGGSSGYTTFVNSARAPIFYDENNTGYYVDPASTSRFNDINNGSSNGAISYGYDVSSIPNTIGCSNWFRSSGATGWYNGSYSGGIYMSDSTWVRIYGTKKFYVDNTNYDAVYTAGGVRALTQMRAPIYYDGNNTSYYGHFDSTGDSIRAAGDIVAYYSSDKRYKENIKLIESPIEKVKAISGVTFEWNEKSHKETGKKDVGVIAQEVEEVLPEIVETRDNGYKAVDYQKLTAVLIEAVKDQQKQIDELKSIINGSS